MPVFTSINTEGQSPSCPTAKKLGQKIHKGGKTLKLSIGKSTGDPLPHTLKEKKKIYCGLFNLYT